MTSDRNSRTGNGKREERAGNKISRPKREKAGNPEVIYCLFSITINLFSIRHNMKGLMHNHLNAGYFLHFGATLVPFECSRSQEGKLHQRLQDETEKK